MEKRVVVVSKPHNDSVITHSVIVSDDQIQIQMTLADFLTHLGIELGPRMLVLSQADLMRRLSIAGSAVVDAMKNSTVHNPAPAGITAQG